MPDSSDKWDIIGFGVAAVDDVFFCDTFPISGDKTFFSEYLRVGGGQTATAFVAATRLGCSCFYAGHLGDNELSALVRSIFDREGIGRRQVTEHPAAMPTHTLVIVTSKGERSNLANLSRVHPAEIGEFEKGLIAKAKCLFVDQSIPRCQARAAGAARANGVPVVGDLESVPPDGAREVYELTSHLIMPYHIARRDLGVSSPEEAVRTIMRDSGRLVGCVTDGDRGAWYAGSEAPEAVRHQPAFAIAEVVDTNGCGDVFHGAYAAALVAGLPLPERMRRGAAAAALKTRKAGGQTGAPTLRELEAFLAEC